MEQVARPAKNDSTRPIGDLWKRAVNRGHGDVMALASYVMMMMMMMKGRHTGRGISHLDGAVHGS